MRAHRYRIIVSGRLGEAGCVAFEDLHIEPHGPDTALIGELDQPGLRGVLDRVLGLGLELVDLALLAGEETETGPRSPGAGSAG
jgi:hypothetical protein